MPVDPPEPEDCTPTKWQSKQKHAFLEAYLRIWVEQVGQRRGVKPTLTVIDLYAAHGWCRDDESGEVWEGTAVLCARCVRDYESKYGNKLYLNTYHPDDTEADAQHEALMRALEKEELNVDGRRIKIARSPIRDAVQDAADWVDSRFPNVWILDPYKPDDLPWEVVERVARNEATYEQNGEVRQRKPEIFINLMTSAIQRNIDTNPEVFSVALGQPESEWRPRLNELKDDGMNIREAIIDLYCARLEDLYGRRPTAIEVTAAEGQIIYAVIFCSSHDAGHFQMITTSVPKFNEWKATKWQPTADAVKRSRRTRRAREKAVRRHLKPLDAFLGQEEE